MPDKSDYEKLARRVRELEEMLDDDGRVLQWEILELLTERWENEGPPGIIENKEMVQRLKTSKGAVARALEVLENLGITNHDTMGFSSYLTPEGYQIAKEGDRTRPLKKLIQIARRPSH